MKNNFLFIKSQTSKVVFSFLILIILTAYIYSNSNQGPKYAIYDRSCELIGMYEIEEYNQILRENDSYLGYGATLLFQVSSKALIVEGY